MVRAELAAGHHADAYERLARLFDRNDVAFRLYLRGHALAPSRLPRAATASSAHQARLLVDGLMRLGQS
jgi:hypothetical protein